MEITKQGPTINEQEVKDFEQLIGYSLPTDYRRFLLTNNGGKPNPDFFDVPGWRYKESFVTDLKGIKTGLKVDLAKLYNLFEGRLPKGFIAVGADPGGNLILLSLDGSTQGKVYFFDHENEPDDATDDVKDYPNIYEVGKSFDQFLNNLRGEREK